MKFTHSDEIYAQNLAIYIFSISPETEYFKFKDKIFQTPVHSVKRECLEVNDELLNLFAPIEVVMKNLL